ncbi:MAG TPA: type IV pilus twitching motility protein PilT [Gemmatimonadaceae bacterium]|jgi:twitching motility protein PilT|nr:type IV pilus twitching motility protein PilT [Gemmatimonadaceae bacterium]
MAQLDRFLAALVSHRASALMLGADVPAQLDMHGTPRAITKTAFNEAQLVGLLQELAPGNARMALDSGAAATFSYTSEDGSFDVQVTPRAEGLRAVVRVHGADLKVEQPAAPAAAASAAGAAAAPSAAPAPARASTPAVQVTEEYTDVGAPPASPERDRIEGMLRVMVQRGSSDLHLRVGEPPIVRVDGEMVRLPDTAALQARELETLVKSIMPERNRSEFDNSSDTDFAHDISGTGRFRCNVMREHKGCAAVFRIIPAKVVSVEQLGISEEVQKLCYLTRGLVLVTGPTGSGKSTTLCSLIDLINRKRSEHVITIEDPIEFVHENKQCIITQRQVGVHTGSFKTALRAALREDPDIVLVGELRDLETVSIAIETAETGHLVFATLHTTSAAGTIDRLIDQFPPDRQEQVRAMLSESLRGVISQTLCKKIGGGRVAAREVLLSIPSIANLIREGKTFQIASVIQTSKRLGMVTLNDALIDLVDAGQVEAKEAYMKANDKTGFAHMLRNRGMEVSFLDPTAEPPAVAAPAGKPELAAKAKVAAR